ncbi:MAG: hypothetical protein K5779_02745 [Saccharofermentans sp.]|nr:hypothetical protein [Saccharofermentans sp.]
MRKTGFIALFLTACMLAAFTGCSTPTAKTAESSVTSATSESLDREHGAFLSHTYLEEYDTFEVTSSSLENGVWIDITSNTHLGENNSPQLSWSPVEGASVYAIYMVDRNSNGFLHWKSNGITETELPCGWAPKLTEYNGPHLGHGYTHTFDIYVIALKAPVERLRGAINGANPKLDSFIQELDTDIDGNTGNIISYGKISGEFTDARYRNT